MCGFFASNDPLVNQESLAVINERLAFRGPDFQSGLISHHSWKLYHSRLSIIAPTDEFAQPFFSPDGGVIVFNGEILNFRELQRQYGLENSDSDTETLDALLSIKAFNLSELEGFFAFVKISASGEITHCARDKFGVKPLFLFKRDGFFSVSSEASVLSDIFSLPYCDQSILEYRAFRAPVFTGSYFEGVESVEPGTCKITGKYFDALEHFSDSYTDVPIESVELGIKRSLSSRLISDVPVGLLFSGGIDSNLLNAISDTDLPKFTGGLPGDYDLEVAKEFAIRDNSDITLINVDDAQFKKRFFAMIALRKEPLSVPNEVVLTFLAEKWAESGGKVLISGEAADEFFAGYDRVFHWAAGLGEFSVTEFLARYCYIPVSSLDQSVIRSAEEFFDQIAGLTPFEMVRYFFVKKHLPVLFRRLDFALMYAGVEGREPLASSAMFELAMKIGPAKLFHGELGKKPLRDLASLKISPDFAYADKVGFPIDLGRIFNGRETKERLENYSIWIEKNLEAIQ